MAKLNLLFIEPLFLCTIFAAYCFRPCLSCPRYQKEALLQFKSLLLGNASFQGPDLGGLESWNHSSDCCTWEHITCSSKSPYQVTDLSLYTLDLERSPTSQVLSPLFRLPTLEVLDLSFNEIVGELPGAGLRNLTKLITLDMSGNSFSGAIPSSLCYLESLEELRLGNNKFRMEIPAEIGNLVNLRVLDLGNNRLAGEIPSSIQKMEKLEELHLHNNSLSGEIPIAWLFTLTNLTDLTLGGNKLSWKSVDTVPKFSLSNLYLRSCNMSGQVPAWLTGQTNLGTLDLSDNILSGPIPRSLFELPSLANLDLSRNNLSGPLPKKVGSESDSLFGSSLMRLDLSSNKLNGTLPPWITKLDLTNLILSGNMFSGSLSPSLFKSKTLVQLILSGNKFSGQMPNNIDHATSLQILLLSRNNFSGPVPKSIFTTYPLSVLDLSRNMLSDLELPIYHPKQSLKSIDLSFNRLSGQLPSAFPPSLEVLVLAQNHFLAGAFPQGLRNMSKLKLLDLLGTNIQGEIPTFISQLSSLKFLILGGNNLVGSLPGSLSNLTNLQLLDLSNNSLTGTIPSQLGNIIGMAEDPNISLNTYLDIEWLLINVLQVFWKNKKTGLRSGNILLYTLLDLSNNQLSGEIPNTLGELRYLKLLNLSHNKLSSGIPSSFGDLENLESLDLSYNSLSGQIPSTFSKFKQLNNLDLSNNKLYGRIPGGGQMDTLDDPNSYANNSGLCGMQNRKPCNIPSNGSVPSDEEEEWFSWMTAGISFPVCFVATVIVLYFVGYFFEVTEGHNPGLLFSMSE